MSLVEFTFDAGDGHAYYDISLVDGYNLPLAIVMQPLANSSLDDIPPNLTNPSCQGTVGLLQQKGYNPYASGYQQFLGTNSSYPLPFDEKVDDQQVSSRWCPWDLQVNPPSKPGDGVYPYPDDNIQRPAFDPCYSACAKYNDAADCGTGHHGSPSTCNPVIIPRLRRACARTLIVMVWQKALLCYSQVCRSFQKDSKIFSSYRLSFVADKLWSLRFFFHPRLILEPC